MRRFRRPPQERKEGQGQERRQDRQDRRQKVRYQERITTRRFSTCGHWAKSPFGRCFLFVIRHRSFVISLHFQPVPVHHDPLSWEEETLKGQGGARIFWERDSGL